MKLEILNINFCPMIKSYDCDFHICLQKVCHNGYGQQYSLSLHCIHKFVFMEIQFFYLISWQSYWDRLKLRVFLKYDTIRYRSLAFTYTQKGFLFFLLSLSKMGPLFVFLPMAIKASQCSNDIGKLLSKNSKSKNIQKALELS